MDFNDAWLESKEKLRGRKQEESTTQNSLWNMHSLFQETHNSLKKIQPLSLTSGQPTSSLSMFGLSSTPPPTSIKPPPTVFADLWGDSDKSPESDRELPANILKDNETKEKNEEILISEEKRKEIIHFELEIKANKALEDNNAIIGNTSEGWTEHSGTSFDDLDLFDIDTALAKQEADLQSIQEHKYGINISRWRRRLDGWGGVYSLTHVNWENEETAKLEVLERLGYTHIPLSKETRDFIIQAARNARLPHRQEVQLTTQLANARTQLALLPIYNKEEQEEDLYATRRMALQAEITEIEQTLTCKMQWVAIKKAVQFLGQGIDLDDLIQLGMLGVIAGIKHFDITKKARLLVCVNMWTFQSLSRAIGDYGNIIRLPVYMIGQIDTLKKLHLQWQILQGHLPTRKALAEAMNMSVDQLTALLKAAEILKASKRAFSLERYAQAERSNDGYSFQATEIDFTVSEDRSTLMLENIAFQQMLTNLFKDLSPREQQVLSLRAGLDRDGDTYKLEEIGQLLMVTRERVRQIEDKARSKVRSQLEKMYPEIEEYLRAKKVEEILPCTHDEAEIKQYLDDTGVKKRRKFAKKT